MNKCAKEGQEERATGSPSYTGLRRVLFRCFSLQARTEEGEGGGGGRLLPHGLYWNSCLVIFCSVFLAVCVLQVRISTVAIWLGMGGELPFIFSSCASSSFAACSFLLVYVMEDRVSTAAVWKGKSEGELPSILSCVNPINFLLPKFLQY